MDSPSSKEATSRLDTRLLSASIVVCAVAVNIVYTPLHLMTEVHVWGHEADNGTVVVSFHAEHNHDYDGDPDHGHHSAHEPHPASDHQILIAVVRDSAIPIIHIALFAHAVVFFEVETSSGTSLPPAQLLEPRTIPPSSPQHIRAPPVG